VNDVAPRGRHSPPGDRSFVVSLLSHLAAGIALVAAVAAAFWGLGQVQSPGDPVIEETAASPTEDAPEESGETADPTPEAEETEEAEAEEEATPEPVADDGDGAAEEDEAEQAVDPSTISLQILDAAGDGGTRASHAGEILRADGYRIVAERRAVRGYERTTVFHSQGHEAAARQIADDHGYTVVEPNPGNLSGSVNVHVVVGEDHPTG
jgi:hypothetical protein